MKQKRLPSNNYTVVYKGLNLKLISIDIVCDNFKSNGDYLYFTKGSTFVLLIPVDSLISATKIEPNLKSGKKMSMISTVKMT